MKPEYPGSEALDAPIQTATPIPDRRLVFRPAKRASVRSWALTGLFILAVFYTLHFARGLIMPIVLAIILSFVLRPTVRALGRVKIKEPLGAALVLILLLGALGAAIYNLAAPAREWIEKGPQSIAAIEAKLRPIRRPVEEVKKATEKVEEMTRGTDTRKTREVTVKGPTLTGTLFVNTQRLVVSGAGMFILLYFLLAAGDLFLAKIVRVLPRLEDKKRAVEVARAMEQEVSIYLFTVTYINVGLGVATAIVLYFLGMPNPVLWGIMVTVLNFVPYLGAMTSLIILSIVALLTFDNLAHALMVPISFSALTTLEGQFLSPLIIGRSLTLNPVVIFLSLLLWGWLWGIGGALLAVPILVTFKILCEHVEPLAPVGEFLAR